MFFYKHNAYKHVQALILVNVFGYLVNKGFIQKLISQIKGLGLKHEPVIIGVE